MSEKVDNQTELPEDHTNADQNALDDDLKELHLAAKRAEREWELKMWLENAPDKVVGSAEEAFAHDPGKNIQPMGAPRKKTPDEMDADDNMWLRALANKDKKGDNWVVA